MTLKPFGIIFFLLTTLLAPNVEAQTKATLTVQINGLRNNAGKIGVTLYNKEQGFPSSSTAAFKHGTRIPTNQSAAMVFYDLPPGTYAVGILHDENNNMEMDYNFFGIPTEGFGISNNPKMVIKAPTFSEAKFEVKPGSNTVIIQTKYM